MLTLLLHGTFCSVESGKSNRLSRFYRKGSELLERGAEVYAYDPVGRDNFRHRYPESEYNIKYAEKPEEALHGAHVCFIFTEWDEIKAVRPQDYKRLMRTPLVYDGRNIYGIEEMKDAGVEYYSIGGERLWEQMRLTS